MVGVGGRWKRWGRHVLEVGVRGRGEGLEGTGKAGRGVVVDAGDWRRVWLLGGRTEE